MELENKEFRVEMVSFWGEEEIKITKNCYPWQCWWFNKGQLDALINILKQLKKKVNP